MEGAFRGQPATGCIAFITDLLLNFHWPYLMLPLQFDDSVESIGEHLPDIRDSVLLGTALPRE